MSETPSQTLSADARQVCEFAASLPLDVLHRATVWVTGAGGFLGTHLVRAFLALDEAYHLRMSVVGVGRDAARMRRRWQELGVRGRPGQLTVGVADLSRPLTRTGPRPDVIVHAASQASPRFYGTDPVGTLLPNTVGTAELLARAVGTNARAFLFLSSSEVYGSVADPLREAETGAVDPVHVRNCYAESKRMGESMCVSWFHQYGVRTHIARLFHTDGPGLALDDGRVFADFVRDVVERRDIRLRGDGTAVRSFCYVTDAVNGMLAVLCRGEPGAAYNVGNPDAAISMRGLADLLATLIPDRHVGVSTDTIADSTGYLASTTSKSVPDVSRLRALGWHPRFSLAEGFRRTILSYLDDPTSSPWPSSVLAPPVNER